MKGFLQDIWHAIERNDGVLINSKSGRAVGVEFENHEMAVQFAAIAENKEVFFNPLACDLHVSGTIVHFLWESDK
jgi:hypothetical protein